MPIDKSTVDSMLNAFRNMAIDLDNKKITGEATDKMKECLATMERYAIEMDDIVSYSTRLATENLYMNFSNFYSKALMSQTSTETDDDSLLKNSISQYEQSLNYLKTKPEMAHLVAPVQKCVEIGKSGVSYPVFLKKCEELGIFEEMKNGRPRPTIEFELHCATEMSDPLRMEMYSKILKNFDALAAMSPLKLVDNVQYRIMREKIEWEYEPKIALWDAVSWGWDKMLDLTIDWLDSFASFAPKDERWIGMTPAETMENIEYTKDCYPGFLKVRENIFKENFDLTWDAIWSHPTYLNKKETGTLWHSEERMELTRKTYLQMKPGAKPTSDLISLTEDIMKNKRYRSELNLKKFGEGREKESVYNFKSFAEFAKKEAGE